MSDEWEIFYEVTSTERVSVMREMKAPDGVHVEEYRYRTVDKATDKDYIIDLRVQALAVGILIEDYDIDPHEHSGECIPITIVTDGNPAIVAYLLGALSYSRSEVCEILGISNQTVSKYIARIRR
jgi:hypothetical protein